MALRPDDWTFWAGFAGGVVLAAFFSGVAARAGQLEDQENALYQAKQQYMQAVIDGKVQTPADQAALYDKTVGLATTHLDSAFTNHWLEVLKRRSTEPENNEIFDSATLARIAAKIEHNAQLAKKGLFTPSEDSGDEPDVASKGAGASRSSQAPEKSERKETALDGSKIPRVLDFSKSQRSPASSL